MLYDVVDAPGALSRDELRSAYEDELREVVRAAGVDAAASESGVPVETVEALVAGDAPPLTLRDAAAILAVSPDSPDADAIVAEVRDHLLLGMTTAVVDVDTLAEDVEVDLTGQEIQQAIEGRTPMTLEELAAIQRAIAARTER
jgi:hypothetical protein